MKVLVLTGPTGVGKTEVAGLFCRRHGFEIVSADSRQVYRGMDIGTAKPTAAEQAAARTHLLDLVAPDTVFSAGEYARAARRVMCQLHRENRRFIVVGGSGFYLRALFQPLVPAPAGSAEFRARLAAEGTRRLYERLQGLDPVRAAQLHPNDRQRIIRSLEVIEFAGRRFSELCRQEQGDARVQGREGDRPEQTEDLEPVYLVLNLPREELYRRVNERFDRMMKTGLLEEVQRLKGSGFGFGTYVANACGYRELLLYLDGKLSLSQAVAQAKARTRAYARRQLTWFRSLEGACWFEASDRAAAVRRLESLAMDAGLIDKSQAGGVSLCEHGAVRI